MKELENQLRDYVKFGDLNGLKSFLGNNSDLDINAKDQDGNTALRFAVEADKKTIINGIAKTALEFALDTKNAVIKKYTDIRTLPYD